MMQDGAAVHEAYLKLSLGKYKADVISELETSGLLESVLWIQFPFDLPCFVFEEAHPCWNPDVVLSSERVGRELDENEQQLFMMKSSIMVIAALLNEKFRLRLNVWAELLNADEQSNTSSTPKVRLLFYTALLMFNCPLKFDLSRVEANVLLQLLIHQFQSLEFASVRRVTMAICGISCWETLSDAQRNKLLEERPELKRIWRYLRKKTENLKSKYSKAVTYKSENVILNDRMTLLDRDGLKDALELFMTTVEVDFQKNIDPKSLRLVSTEGWTAVDVFSGISGIQVETQKSKKTSNGDSTAQEIRNENPTDLNAHDFLFCERFLEFLTDVLSQLPTRRFLRPLLQCLQILPRLQFAKLYCHSEAALIRQLATLLAGYEEFEIDDTTGEPLETSDVDRLFYDRIKALQISLFKLFPDNCTLKEVAVGPAAKLGEPLYLEETLSQLNLTQLVDICQRLSLIKWPSFLFTALRALAELVKRYLNQDESSLEGRLDLEEFASTKEYQDSHKLLRCIIKNNLIRRPSQIEAINKLPLFPTETVIWDPNLIPTENYKGDFSLALPKLNLQFLTIRDYLLRNFHLFRLETSYEIREDIEDAVWRMKPCLDYGQIGTSTQDKLDTQFNGNARMAIPINYFSVVYIKEPAVDSDTPAEVRAEITVNLKQISKEIRHEWDLLRQCDVVFLVSIKAPLNRYEGRPADLASISEFLEAFGVIAVRGCEIVEVLDEEGTSISEGSGEIEMKDPFGDQRIYRVLLDANQYQRDVEESVRSGVEDVYSSFNLLIRRKPAENNFKAILETIRNLINDSSANVIPSWLHNLFLGYGDPSSARYTNMSSALEEIDFVDTFLDEQHVKASFPCAEKISFDASSFSGLTIVKFLKAESEPLNTKIAEGLEVSSYASGFRGPYPQCEIPRNSVRFTACQVEAIRSGVNPGLTLVVGPPGTGKTDTAVQIALLLHKNFPAERILILAHSNQALNDLFEKIAALDIDERYLLRLGMGEKELRVASDRTNVDLSKKKDFSKWGRVNHMLQRRVDLLKRVDQLGISLQVPGDSGASCETAIQFYRRHVVPRVKRFFKQIEKLESTESFQLSEILRDMRHQDGQTNSLVGPSGLPMQKPIKIASEKPKKNIPKKVQVEDEEEFDTDEEMETVKAASSSEVVNKYILTVEDVDRESCTAVEAGTKSAAEVLFPFHEFFSDAPDLFPVHQKTIHKDIAEGCFRYLKDLFKAVEECRAFELLRNLHDRTIFLLTHHSKIIAMTCTHAALVRQQMIDMNLTYDTLIMEEAAQVLEVETFVPMTLQRTHSTGCSKLKRVILLGDHHQLPPVVKNRGFQQHGRLDQSMFSRMIRLQVPYTQLDAQGRCRSSIRALFGWRYTSPILTDLPLVNSESEFLLANPGFCYDYQFVNVPDYENRGESCPLPHFFQNLGEAEYAVALFMYMRLLGYPASKIAMLTTYNGQKKLLRETIQKRCGWNPAIGWPAVVSTVDKFQGQQADYVILSLVRTKSPGHLRDVRRLIVAVSRARLGIYFLGRFNLFADCLELSPVFKQLAERPLQLALNLTEAQFSTNRQLLDKGTETLIPDIQHLWNTVQNTARKVLATVQAPAPPP